MFSQCTSMFNARVSPVVIVSRTRVNGSKTLFYAGVMLVNEIIFRAGDGRGFRALRRVAMFTAGVRLVVAMFTAGVRLVFMVRQSIVFVMFINS